MHKNSINKVILIGHVGSSPEIRYTPTGAAISSFSIATNEVWLNADKEKQERVEWHSLIAWNKLAEFSKEYIKKGQLIYIEGSLHTNSWRDKEGNSRKKIEIICSTITPLEWNKEEN